MQDGEALELEVLLPRWRSPVTGLLLSFGLPRGDALELAQDVFAEAFLSRARFRGDPADEEAVGRWLRGIARNLHAAWRRRRREPNVPLEHVDPQDTTAPDSGAGEALRRCVARLPDELRAAVQVHYLEETSVRATAALLGVTAKTVEGRLYRARRELARRMEVELAREGRPNAGSGGGAR